MRAPVLAVAAALLAWSPAAPAVAESLADALRDTYAQSPRLDAERARLRAVDEQVPQALAGWRPSLRASGGYSLDWQREEFRFSPSSDPERQRDSELLHQLNGRLVAQQSLYAGGETVAGTSRAENQVRAGRARLAEAEQAVLLDAVETYAGVVRARAVLRYSQDNLDRLRQYLAGTEERFRVAELTRTDVAQAASRVAGAVADLARAESELEAALSEYERVVGHPPGELAPAVPLAELPTSVADAQALAPGHPRIRQASFDLDAARDQVDVDTAQLLPDVNLVGDLNGQRNPSDTTRLRENASIGAEVVIPLYQRGTEYSRVRQAKQTAIQRRYDLTDTERAIRREIVRSFEALAAARRQIEALDRQVAAAEEALVGTREEALAGARTVLDVLDAELELFVAQIRRARALEQAVATSYQLKAAVGGLSLAGLGLGAETYDPEANYRAVRDRWFGLTVADPAGAPAPTPPPGK